MEKIRKLIWDKQALIKFEKSLHWISEVSIQQAELVERAILEKISEIQLYPERYPPDKYVIDNSGSYRSFETHSCRVTYKHTKDSVLILRVRHVKQNPENI